MSKVFSIIGLETNTGIRDVGFMSGIPKVEDIQKSQLYKELVEDRNTSWLRSNPSVVAKANRRMLQQRISIGSNPILNL